MGVPVYIGVDLTQFFRYCNNANIKKYEYKNHSRGRLQ
jgi:hypothetical protein